MSKLKIEFYKQPSIPPVKDFPELSEAEREIYSKAANIKYKDFIDEININGGYLEVYYSMNGEILGGDLSGLDCEIKSNIENAIKK